MQRKTGSISITKQINKFSDTQILSEAYQNTYIKICIHLRGINTCFSAETICSTYSIYKAALYYYGSHLINTNLSFMPQFFNSTHS